MKSSPRLRAGALDTDRRHDPATVPPAVLVGSAMLVPTALLVVLLAVLVVRSTVPGDANSGLAFLSGGLRAFLRPEPGEQRVYLVLLSAPLVLSAAMIAVHTVARPLRLSGTRGWLPPAAAAGQALVLSLVVISLLRQQIFYPYFVGWQLAALTVVAILVGIAVMVPRALAVLHPLVGFRARKASADSRRRRVLARSLWAAAALMATFAFLSTTIYTDANIALAPFATWYHVPFTSEEFSSVLNGLTPLVDFTPQYTSLLPYLAAPYFAVAGMTIGSFTTLMALFSAAGLMSVFVALERVTGRGSVAALLYLPFLAMTFYPTVRTGDQVHTVGAYYGILPLRYAFPLLLTALVVSFATSARRWRSALLLGAVAGAGLVNNLEFGLAALGAVLVSVFVTEASRRATTGGWRAVAAAELRVTAGAAVAVAVFSVGTLLRSGSLPNFAELLYFSRQFAVGGFYMLPLPGILGLHLVMYLTFVLALVLALAAAVLGSVDERRRSRLAPLAYSAVFGLGAGAYYVGRSHQYVLVAIFAAWTLCLVFLAVELGASAREIFAAPLSTRWLLAAPSACIAGLLVLCASALSLDGFIFEQPHRLASQTAPQTFAAVDMERFVASCTRPGQDVMMIFPLGHRIAYDNGVFDHFPYNHPGSVVTTRQVTAVVDALRAHQVSAVFTGPLAPELVAALDGAGYRRVLDRPPTIPVEQAAATGSARLSLWRLDGSPVACG